ncbi:MAG: peptidylprolyl isomerase [Bradymonadia bacterium]|jgi:peptidylprolyl isomerase
MTTEAPDNVGAPPWNADLTMSGLMSRVIHAGYGERHATAQDRVTVHYSGWTTDGEMFDSSVERGTPASFPLSGLIEGWQEGIPLMVTGEIRRFWIPANLAYGNEGAGGRPTGMLVFDIELISIDT